MTTTTAPQKTDDRIWAVLAHGSALLFVLGPLISLVVWATQRRKSAYASFHALQAMSCQVAAYWLWILAIPLMIILPVLVVIGFAVAGAGSGDEPAALFIAMQAAMFGSIFGTLALYVLLGVLGGALCLAGREFRYPVIGKRLARFLGYHPGEAAPLNEAQEDRLVASVGHANAIVTLWGLIFPLVVWISQKDRSPLLRFQSLQALIYQGIGAIAYFGTMAIYMIFIFGWMFLVLANPETANSPDAFAASLAPMLVFGFVYFVLGPIFLFFAVLAAVRILRGHDYRYPILGNQLARRMTLSASAAPEAPQ